MIKVFASENIFVSYFFLCCITFMIKTTFYDIYITVISDRSLKLAGYFLSLSYLICKIPKYKGPTFIIFLPTTFDIVLGT